MQLRTYKKSFSNYVLKIPRLGLLDSTCLKKPKFKERLLKMTKKLQSTTLRKSQRRSLTRRRNNRRSRWSLRISIMQRKRNRLRKRKKSR